MSACVVKGPQRCHLSKNGLRNDLNKNHPPSLSAPLPPSALGPISACSACVGQTMCCTGDTEMNTIPQPSSSCTWNCGSNRITRAW